LHTERPIGWTGTRNESLKIKDCQIISGVDLLVVLNRSCVVKGEPAIRGVHERQGRPLEWQ
jgi:hypothetical protein